jgi:hypothetical protein
MGAKIMFRKAGFAALLLMGVAASASAAPQCYRTSEIEADQAMRYQAKLMVLSDACRSSSYSEFIHRNSAAIISYQHALIARFRRSNGRHAEDAFDRFQTRLANQYALGAGQQTVATLCAKSASFLQKAQAFVASEFRHYMARQAAEERHAYTSCAERSAGNTFTPD